MPPPDEEEYVYRARYRDTEWDLHRRIEKLMLPQGWTAPEFKQDSYVITVKGPILVDASMPQRIGKRLLKYTNELLRGEHLETSPPSTYAFYVRREIGEGTITEEQAAPVLQKLQELEEQGDRWPT